MLLKNSQPPVSPLHFAFDLEQPSEYHAMLLFFPGKNPSDEGGP
jgi:hypothetical protein